MLHRNGNTIDLDSMSITIDVSGTKLTESDLIIAHEAYEVMTIAETIIERGYPEERAYDMALKVRDAKLRKMDQYDISEMDLIDEVCKKEELSHDKSNSNT